MPKITYDEVLEFAESADFGQAENIKKLRLMWTDFCKDSSSGIRDVDTYEYDSKIMEIWETLSENLTCPYSSLEFERFDNMMAKFLV